MMDASKLRDLPAVHELVESLAQKLALVPRALITDEIRRELDRARAAIRAGREPFSIEAAVECSLAHLARPTLVRVINATGVILHTNLGRAPLLPFQALPGYSNLEYDLATGHRGKRDTHISSLLERLLGAPAIAVNNNAAAVLLALNELAAGGEVIVSRGELIEIGDGFRIPEIMARSGAVLREVGTTNRTSIADYADAIGDRTRLLMRVHPSNFRITGFTARPPLAELAALGRDRGIPVYEDLGSGCVVDLRAFGVDEPLVSESLQAGADVVSFSGDKLLGGPQAGILAGRADFITRLRRNPLFRALRLDKLILQSLSETLRNLLFERWDQIPALHMIRQSPESIRARAQAFAGTLPPALGAEIIEGQSVIGGGATPEAPLATWLIALAGGAVLEQRLRTHNPAIIARIQDDCVLLDLRTVAADEEPEIRDALEPAESEK
jgi:L-seryl-tRNA(Ser) seleniumtransferase